MKSIPTHRSACLPNQPEEKRLRKGLKWYSHKFHGPGVRYELAFCIRTGDIVWAYGGVLCGEWADLRLVRDVFIIVFFKFLRNVEVRRS